MPTTLLRHEHSDINTNIMSTSATQAQTNAKNGLDKHPPLSPTDDDATHMATQDARTKKVDKKSPEYLMKSMLAGGIAGCAVRSTPNHA
jgi:solute carrier family 25 protein 16